jgi:hypothetical protein
VIEHCIGIAGKEGIGLRRSYTRTIKKLMLAAAAYNFKKLMRQLLAYLFVRLAAILSMMGTSTHAAIAA